MNAVETVFLALRLLGLSAAVLLLPGVLVIKALRVSVPWDLHIVFALAVSYSWVFVLSAVVPLFGWTVMDASGFTIACMAILTVVLLRRRTKEKARSSPMRSNERLAAGAFAILIGASATAGWIIESPFTGEEALDFTSVSRFADGGEITFDNTSLLASTRPVYLFQPYQLALGMIARWSGTSPLVTYIKFRSFLMPLSLVLVFALIRRLAPTHIEAAAAFLVVLLFLATDFDTWQANSLFPLVRRGGVGAGICEPTMMVLCLIGTRRVQDPMAARTRRVALGIAPAMLAASLSTHPLEMLPLLFFATGLVFTALTSIDRTGDRRLVVGLLLLLAGTAASYVALQSRLVPYVAEYDRDERQVLRAELRRLASSPVEAVAGGPTEARELLSRSIPATTAVVAGIPALALAALRAPAAAAILAAAFIPLALVYATPIGYVTLTLFTSIETVRDVNAYFGLLGLLALAFGLTAFAHAALRAAAWRQNGFLRVLATAAIGSVVTWAVWRVGRHAVEWLATRTVEQPEVLLLVAIIVAIFVFAIGVRSSRDRLVSAPPGPAVVVAAACLAAPFAVPEWGFDGIFARREPVTILAQVTTAMAGPSVMNWPLYYEALKTSIAPPLPVPRVVIDALRKRLPPRQIVLADPRYSCALVVLLDAYCINPESIYGHYFQPAARYQAEYANVGEGKRAEHPFFNARESPTSAETRLLKDYRVSYLLADPQFAAQTAAKLRDVAPTAQLEMDVDGYQLYRVE